MDVYGSQKARRLSQEAVRQRANSRGAEGGRYRRGFRRRGRSRRIDLDDEDGDRSYNFRMVIQVGSDPEHPAGADAQRLSAAQIRQREYPRRDAAEEDGFAGSLYRRGISRRAVSRKREGPQVLYFRIADFGRRSGRLGHAAFDARVLDWPGLRLQNSRAPDSVGADLHAPRDQALSMPPATRSLSSRIVSQSRGKRSVMSALPMRRSSRHRRY